MTMFELMERRLPDGLTVASCKEKSTKYVLVLEYDGIQTTAELPKACAPGKQGKVINQAICSAMMSVMLKKGDADAAQRWMDKMLNSEVQGEENAPDLAELVKEYAEASRAYIERKTSFSSDVSALNRCARARNKILRAILDQYGYTDTEVIS